MSNSPQRDLQALFLTACGNSERRADSLVEGNHLDDAIRLELVEYFGEIRYHAVVDGNGM